MARKDCCNNPANLAQPIALQRADLRVDRCIVCNCKHYQFQVDTGHLGLKLSR